MLTSEILRPEKGSMTFPFLCIYQWFQVPVSPSKEWILFTWLKTWSVRVGNWNSGADFEMQGASTTCRITVLFHLWRRNVTEISVKSTVPLISFSYQRLSGLWAVAKCCCVYLTFQNWVLFLVWIGQHIILTALTASQRAATYPYLRLVTMCSDLCACVWLSICVILNVCASRGVHTVVQNGEQR